MFFVQRTRLRGKRRSRETHQTTTRHTRGRHRRLRFQQLESRELLSSLPLINWAELTALTPLSVSENSGEKPQSKVWRYADDWWSVLPDDSGTWLWRLDDASWNPMLRLSSNTSVHADVRAMGDLAHVLLYDGRQSEFLTLSHSSDAVGGYVPWAVQPELVGVTLTSGVETATIDVDSTGRIWLASDTDNSVEVRYSDFPYASFSTPITIASGIGSDDISAIVAIPGGAVGVLWSNQNVKRFGFSLHWDGDSPTAWSNDEVPASLSALSQGGGMADDHLNMAVTSDGTVYAAVKTSYDSGGYPQVALLVRRPGGDWDPLYTVDTRGTRPIVVLNEDAGRLIVAYTESESGGKILFRESPIDVISFGPVGTLIAGSVNNVTSTKDNFTDELVVIASGGSKIQGSRFRWSEADAPPDSPSSDSEPTTPPPATPITVSFQNGLNGYQGTQDTSLLAKFANMNLGATGELQADGSPDEAALVRWDLSSIAPGSVIQSATITVNVTNKSSETYEIYELLRAWSESQTTWNQAISGTPWQTAGAQGAQDRSSVVLGTLAGSALGQRVITLNSAGVAAIQRWIDEPNSNHGLIFQDYANATDGVMFSSREASNASLRPKLTITYVAAGSVTSPSDPEPPDEPDSPPSEPDSPPVVQNQPPQVDAGSDRQIEFPATATLNGKVTDDGLPVSPGGVSASWTKLSGPGTVAFANPTSAGTTATFSQPGTYVLRLTATDGQLTAGDDMTVVVSAPPPPPAPTSGLVGSWQLDETTGTTAADASGLGNNGTTQGGAAWIAGHDGNALQLDGKDDYVVVPDSASLDARDAITVSAWIRPSRTATQYLVKKARQGKTDGFELSLSSTGTVFVRFNHASAGDKFRIDSKTRYPSNGNTWMHVAATYDGSTIKLYINGVLDNSRAASFQIGVNDLGLAIGAEDNGHRPMGGAVDAVRVYNRALSDAEIKGLWTGSVTSPSDPEPPSEPDSPPVVQNQPPQVNAGADRQIEFPATATLNGNVTDDGLPVPPGVVSTSWTKLSGPGTVAFANPTSAGTTATFSQPGTYVLRLTATDGQLTASDDMTVVVSAPPPPSPLPTSGLVGSWQLDETTGTTAADASGLGNNGTTQGGAAWIAGRDGNALQLDGKDDYVVVPDSASLDVRDTITVSAWIRPSRTATQYIVKKARQSKTDGFELSLSSTGTVFVRFNHASAGDKFRIDSKTRYPSNGNTWMHVAATYDGSTIKLYINGVLENTRAASFQIGVNDLALAIGAEDNGYRPMRGAVDGVRVYGRALSDTEIEGLWAG